MKKLVLSAVIAVSVLSGCAQAQPHHRHHHHQPNVENVLIPLIIGGVIGATIASEPRPPVVVYQEPREEYYLPPVYQTPRVVVYLEDCRVWDSLTQYRNCEKRNAEERFRARQVQNEYNRRSGDWRYSR